MKFIKRLLAWIMIILAIICMILAIMASAGASLSFLPSFLAGLSAKAWILLGVLAVGSAYLIDSETASKAMGKIAAGVSDVLDKTIGVVGSATGSIFRHFGAWIMVGVGVLFLLNSNSSNITLVDRKDANESD